MDTLVVTAYYQVRTGKHTTTEYKQWISNFFSCVTCPVIVFCDQTFQQVTLPNVRYVVRDFSSFAITQEPWKSRWEQWHQIDHEKHIHSPELYQIWAAKQEFVQEAIKLQEAKAYVWCDIGCFRTVRPGSFKRTLNFIRPGKITCLNVTNLPGIREKVIGGGVLAGDKDAWRMFTERYLAELERDINGKDQLVYMRILNDSNAIIVNPTYQYGDAWFFLTYIFSF
jgi:hypothetical protein